LAQLTDDERRVAVVYHLATPVLAGTKLEVPQAAITVPWDAELAFVDREPLANWGHSCRHIFINRESGEALSFEARFPPLRRDDHDNWRIAFRASGVPDSALLIPH